MFTAIKWFFRLPWFLWLIPMAAAGWFAWDNAQAFTKKTAEYQTLAEQPFEPEAQTLGAFGAADLSADGTVSLTAQIDWAEYYELGGPSSVLGDATFGYMLFAPGTRVVEGFAFFPGSLEDDVHALIEANEQSRSDYGVVTAFPGNASFGHPSYESEVREWAAFYGFEAAETLVFVDVWPQGPATAALGATMNHFTLSVLAALAAGVSFLMAVISGVARLAFGKRHKVDPTQLQDPEEATIATKAKRASTAYGMAKTAGDTVLGNDAASAPSLSDAADMGLLDDAADLLGPAGMVLRAFGKGDKRSSPLPAAVEPISKRNMGKVSARTAALMAKQGAVPEHVTPEAAPAQAERRAPAPSAKRLSFKEKMRRDPFAELALR